VRGRFITFEGIEGAGKSTQAKLLAEALRACGVHVLLTREPGGAPNAEMLREILLHPEQDWTLLAETLLHFAARAEHVARTISPALAAGTWVVCDRFYDSTMAYQGYGKGLSTADIQTLKKLIGLDPDLTLILDVTIETGFSRISERHQNRDHYEQLGDAFFLRVREGFREIAAREPARCVLLPAEATREAVAQHVRCLIRERFGVAL